MGGLPNVTGPQINPLPRNFQEYAENRTSQCEQGDLTEPYALVIQGLVGLLAFAMLIVKRLLEPKNVRRTWLVWSLDTSKQGLSMILMHLINVWFSENNHGQNSIDPCTFYLTSFLLDSSIGLVVIWIGLGLSQSLIIKYNICGGKRFGEYCIVPPQRSRNRSRSLNQSDNSEADRQNCTLNSYTSSTGRLALYPRTELDSVKNVAFQVVGIQVLSYLIVTIIAKGVVYGILQLDSLKMFFYELRIIMTDWTDSKEVEIMLVMLVVPFFLNCFMFWIVDNILMQGTSCLTMCYNKFIQILSSSPSSNASSSGSADPEQQSLNQSINFNDSLHSSASPAVANTSKKHDSSQRQPNITTNNTDNIFDDTEEAQKHPTDSIGSTINQVHNTISINHQEGDFIQDDCDAEYFSSPLPNYDEAIIQQQFNVKSNDDNVQKYDDVLYDTVEGDNLVSETEEVLENSSSRLMDNQTISQRSSLTSQRSRPTTLGTDRLRQNLSPNRRVQKLSASLDSACDSMRNYFDQFTGNSISNLPHSRLEISNESLDKIRASQEAKSED